MTVLDDGDIDIAVLDAGSDEVITLNGRGDDDVVLDAGNSLWQETACLLYTSDAADE